MQLNVRSAIGWGVAAVSADVVRPCIARKYSKPIHFRLHQVHDHAESASAHRAIRANASRPELTALGFSDEEVSKVEDVTGKSLANDIGDSVRVIVTYTGSVKAARELILRNPNLLCCQLPSWVEFLTAFGMDQAQVQHVLCQTPEAFVENDLVRAGDAILVFRRLGLSDYAAAQLITYYPQLLGKDEKEIRAMLDLLGRYQTGIDALSC